MNELRRVISLPLITFYGIGSILGAGIYVLISKIAGISGMYMPVSFIIAGIVAGFSAFSYAELSSRYPKSAGEAVYLYEAFSLKSLCTLIGNLVFSTALSDDPAEYAEGVLRDHH